MHLSEINIYPVKSLKGIGLQEAIVEERGFRHDRRWMLIDGQNKFLTQREFPKMSTISVAVGKEELNFSAPGNENLRVAARPEESRREQVIIWQSVCTGEIYGSAVNKWFIDVLGTKCNLVYMPDDSRRHVNARFDRGDDVVSFADGYPFLLIGETSLADLNSRLDTPLSMNRFRPNLVVSGSNAFAEDNWKKIRIGEAIFRTTKPCERCVITTIDQIKGERDGKEPLKTLASFRMAKTVHSKTYASLGLGETAVLFGENLIPETIGALVKVGDMVEILETR